MCPILSTIVRLNYQYFPFDSKRVPSRKGVKKIRTLSGCKIKNVKEKAHNKVHALLRNATLPQESSCYEFLSGGIPNTCLTWLRPPKKNFFYDVSETLVDLYMTRPLHHNLKLVSTIVCAQEFFKKHQHLENSHHLLLIQPWCQLDRRRILIIPLFWDHQITQGTRAYTNLERNPTSSRRH